MYDRTICTGDQKEINDSLESFPSGHSTAAFAGLIYLSLYLNAQLKVMSAHNPQYWKMILFFCPILGATLIAGALTIDECKKFTLLMVSCSHSHHLTDHNWYDVVAGAIIGTCTALVAFRSTFAAIMDFRFNHILLPRTTSAMHRRPWLEGPHSTPYFTYQPAAEMITTSLPFTREGGWGWGEEAFVGAPNDATSLGGSGMRMGRGVQGGGLHNTGGMNGGNAPPLRGGNAANAV
jgi:diacylglycerol diphosphate phosphatase/phosphatidate phosphatase